MTTATRSHVPCLRKRSVRVGLSVAAAVALYWVSGVRVYSFSGDSMAPVVKPGDHFIGLVGLWGLRDPQRFALLIFDVPPTSKWAGARIPWMKRLVGLPREHVRLSGADLFINGRRVDAPFLHRDPHAAPRKDFEVTLGADEYCVLGDNLDHTLEDSRALGPIHRSLIKGSGVVLPAK